MSELNFETKLIHSGYTPAEHNNAVSVPIYQTTAFDLGDIDRARRLWTGDEAGGIYSRAANPTVGVLEQRIKALDGGSDAIAVASGMAAISCTALYLAEGGGNIISSSSIYGAAQEAFTHFLPRFGVETRFVKNRDDINEYEALIDENTRAIFIESISNPNIELYDYEKLAEIAHRHGVLLVVDNTIATPYLFRPFEHGADIAIYSATKGISGHGNVIAGIVVEKGGFEFDKNRFPQLYEKSYKMRDLENNLRSPLEFAPNAPIIAALKVFHLEFLGCVLSPFDAYLALQGLCTLPERLDKQIASTKKIVEYLENSTKVSYVKHPFAKGSKYADLAQKYFPKGAGSVISFGFNGTREQMKKFISSLKVFSYHVNLGDVRSLIANSPETTHAELNPDIQQLADIPADLLRLSIGLENADDLINDLDSAFKEAFDKNEKC